MNKTINNYLENSQKNKCYKTLIMVLLISELVLVNSRVIPYSTYVSSLLIDLFILLRTKKITRAAVLLLFIAEIAFLGGIFLSIFNRISNRNFLYCIAYGLNMLAFISFSELSGEKLDEESLTKIMKILFAFGVFSCIYNVVKNYSLFLTLNLAINSYSISFSSFFYNRNTFASMLGLYSFAYLYLIAKEEKKAFYVIAYLFLLSNVWFTFSRDGIAFEIILLIVFVSFQIGREREKRKYVLLLLAVILSTIIAVLIINRNIVFIRHFIIRRDNTDSLSIRSQLWHSAIDSFLKQPFVGYGPASGEYVIKRYLGNTLLSSFHNTYLEILVYGGAVFALVHIVVIKKLFNAVSRIKRKDILLYQLIVALLIAYFVYSLFETSMLFALGGKGELTTILVYLIPMLYAKEDY